MGKYSIVVEETARKELLSYKRNGDKTCVKRIEQIISDLAVDPYNGIGKPEALKYQMSGYWSRRINQKNRLVYRVEEHTVVIVSAYGHYKDK